MEFASIIKDIFKMPVKRVNTVQCKCEKPNLSNLKSDKYFMKCDVCSERSFLKKSSSPIVSSSDSSSFAEE